MTDKDDIEKPMRQAAGVIGGVLLGFVLGDAGLASSDGITFALAASLGLLAFAFVR